MRVGVLVQRGFIAESFIAKPAFKLLGHLVNVGMLLKSPLVEIRSPAFVTLKIPYPSVCFSVILHGDLAAVLLPAFLTLESLNPGVRLHMLNEIRLQHKFLTADVTLVVPLTLMAE